MDVEQAGGRAQDLGGGLHLGIAARGQRLAAYLRVPDIAVGGRDQFDVMPQAGPEDGRAAAADLGIVGMDAHFRSFGRHVLPLLLKKQIGVLGMKPIGSGIILHSNAVTPTECFHDAMSVPTSVVITGIDGMEVLKQDLAVVRDFRPLSTEQMAALLRRTEQAAAEGRYELFKTNNIFDSTAQTPQWLG